MFWNKIKKFLKWLFEESEIKRKEKNLVTEEDYSSNTSSSESIVHNEFKPMDEYKKAFKLFNEKVSYLDEIRNGLERAKKEYEMMNENIKNIKDLVLVGFLAVVAGVISVFIGYWIMAVDKSELIEKCNEKILNLSKEQNFNISNMQLELNNLKNDMGNFRKLNPYLK